MALLRSSLKIGTLLIFLRILTATAEQTGKQPPCDISETVYLDPSMKSKDGLSYNYRGTIVPINETWTYNYRILEGNEKQPIDNQTRGCLCKFRPCISICCPFNGEYHNSTCLDTRFKINPLINITTKQGNTISVNIQDQFVLQYYRPCKSLFYFQPEKYPEDNYTILEDGSLHTLDDDTHHTKMQYCLSPRMLDSRFAYTPLQCTSPVPNADAIRINGFALMISVPFMLLTIIVYLILPDLRTIHGLSFCCYLAGLSVGYSIMVILNFVSNIPSFWCAFLGYTTYFAFMSAFFWLSVISFDLYCNIRGPGTNQKMKQFRLYCLYAWGLAFICLICTHIAQHSDYISKYWKSGIGSDEYCFLNTYYGWGAAIYFYIPILLILCFNIVMFVLTFMQIRKRMQLAAFNGTHKPHHEHRALFMTFLRLFILMGITWIAEILSYFTPRDSWLHNVFNVTDFLNGIQGVIIFLLFVCGRKSVRKQLLKKFGKNDGPALDQTQEMSQCL